MEGAGFIGLAILPVDVAGARPPGCAVACHLNFNLVPAGLDQQSAAGWIDTSHCGQQADLCHQQLVICRLGLAKRLHGGCAVGVDVAVGRAALRLVEVASSPSTGAGHAGEHDDALGLAALGFHWVVALELALLTIYRACFVSSQEHQVVVMRAHIGEAGLVFHQFALAQAKGIEADEQISWIGVHDLSPRMMMKPAAWRVFEHWS